MQKIIAQVLVAHHHLSKGDVLLTKTSNGIINSLITGIFCTIKIIKGFMKKNQQLQTPKGFRDFLPAAALLREKCALL
jgi:hypothetical protein